MDKPIRIIGSFLSPYEVDSITPGYIADLVLFDPATVIDNSTIENPEAAPTGIAAVMNCGEWVIDSCRHSRRRRHVFWPNVSVDQLKTALKRAR